MKFSVVIPTCERPAELADCLRRLAPGAQTLPAADYEVIVTDDGAAPVRELLAANFPWARWAAGPRRGPAANRNHGGEVASGEWLVFTDDDCTPEPGWLAGYAAAVRDRPAVRVLEGRTLASGTRTAIDMEAPVNSHGGFLWSCNFAIDRTLFRELGGFDTGFPSAAMEDVELRLRLRERGERFKFVPEALVYHPWRKRKGVRAMRQHAEAVDYLLTKHPAEAAKFSVSLIVRQLLANLRRVTVEAIRTCGGRGWWRAVGLELVYFRWSLGKAIGRRGGRGQMARR